MFRLRYFKIARLWLERRRRRREAVSCVQGQRSDTTFWAWSFDPVLSFALPHEEEMRERTFKSLALEVFIAAEIMA